MRSATQMASHFARWGIRNLREGNDRNAVQVYRRLILSCFRHSRGDVGMTDLSHGDGFQAPDLIFPSLTSKISVWQLPREAWFDKGIITRFP